MAYEGESRDSFSTNKPDHQMSLQEKIAAYKGETFGGTVVDVDGKNPVLQPDVEAPNIIVNGEKAEDWNEGEAMNGVKVTTVKETYMFGERIISDEERQEKKGSEYIVKLRFMGQELTSDKFTDKEDAEDLKNFLENQADWGRVEMEQLR